jgi:hypothetical protein
LVISVPVLDGERTKNSQSSPAGKKPAPRGNLEANGYASADSWTKALDFLEKHLDQDWRLRPRPSSNERA